MKKKIYGDSLREKLLASSRDRLHRFLLADGSVRGAILNGTRMINEMRSSHGLGILETLVLGRTHLGAGLMAGDLKGDDRISVRIDCSGPIRGLMVEANGFGEIRGYLEQVPIPIRSPLESFDMSSLFGEGVLSVTRSSRKSLQPQAGRVALEYGNIAPDLANYCRICENLPTAFNLGIKFDGEGEVFGAGGICLHAAPGGGETLAAELENRILAMPSLGLLFGEKRTGQDIILEQFGGYDPQFIGDHRVEFMCHCNAERMRGFIEKMPIPELAEILEKGPLPLEIRCRHCSTPYTFERALVREIHARRLADR